jgi:hypothetical protein
LNVFSEFATHIRTADTARHKASEKPLAIVDKIKRKHDEQAEAEKESEAVNSKREELKAQAKARRTRIQKLRGDVNRLEKIVEKEPDVGDTTELVEKRVCIGVIHQSKMLIKALHLLHV